MKGGARSGAGRGGIGGGCSRSTFDFDVIHGGLLLGSFPLELLHSRFSFLASLFAALRSVFWARLAARRSRRACL